MPNNELYLEISDDCKNEKVLRVFDTSHYCDEVIENYLLEVLAPRKDTWTPFFVQKNFSLALNSSSLRYSKVSTVEELRELPDGIYEFKQSYKPNIHTLVHYYHLRTVVLQQKVKKQWDNLISDHCKISREEFHVHRDKLREIEEFILAAKFKVEECLDKKKGKELYDWAEKLLEQYTNECQCKM